MKAIMNWSGGKDSALCLYKALQEGMAVEALVTSFSGGRVTMHGVPELLVEAQAEAIGLPLVKIHLPPDGGMESYEQCIRHSNEALRQQGFTHVISGDIFLEDLKLYREALYAKDGLDAVFPLWGQEPDNLVKEFLQLGFRAIIVSVHGDHFEKNACGALLDEQFIKALPSTVDICGEKGEYHSFCFDGPVFREPVHFTKGVVISRKYARPGGEEKECFGKASPEVEFHFQELLP